MNIEVICGDAYEEVNKLPNKSIQMICIDPPYNIGKADWDDIWGNVKKGYKKKDGDFEDYFEWLGDIFYILSLKLKDNGSFFFFHNNFRHLSKLDEQLQMKTNLEFKQLLIWNKRFDGASNKGYLDGFLAVDMLNNFQKMAEYICFYTFDNSSKLKEERQKRKIKQTQISAEIKSKTGGMTGWYSNLETGKNLPTKKTIKPITKYLDLMYDDIVPKFNNQKTHHSVWNYELDSKKMGHITPKPIELLKNIILHTTDENDLCLDCFAGSGSFGVACAELNRNCILIEKEEEYINIIHKRLNRGEI